MNHKYVIPFCYLPDSKSQTIDMADSAVLRSEFQIQTIYNISQRDDFAYFVICGLTDPVILATEFKSPIHVMWYDKEGYAHAMYIGVRRMLQAECVAPPHNKPNPVPLDSIVYAVRRSA